MVSYDNIDNNIPNNIHNNIDRLNALRRSLLFRSLYLISINNIFGNNL